MKVELTVPDVELSFANVKVGDVFKGQFKYAYATAPLKGHFMRMVYTNGTQPYLLDLTTGIFYSPSEGTVIVEAIFPDAKVVG